jgi:hypothetical protein
MHYHHDDMRAKIDPHGTDSMHHEHNIQLKQGNNCRGNKQLGKPYIIQSAINLCLTPNDGTHTAACMHAYCTAYNVRSEPAVHLLLADDLERFSCRMRGDGGTHGGSITAPGLSVVIRLAMSECPALLLLSTPAPSIIYPTC